MVNLARTGGNGGRGGTPQKREHAMSQEERQGWGRRWGRGLEEEEEERRGSQRGGGKSGSVRAGGDGRGWAVCIAGQPHVSPQE